MLAYLEISGAVSCKFWKEIGTRHSALNERGHNVWLFKAPEVNALAG